MQPDIEDVSTAEQETVTSVLSAEREDILKDWDWETFDVDDFICLPEIN